MHWRKYARQAKRSLRFARQHAFRFLLETAHGAPDMPIGQRVRYLFQGYHPLEASWYHQAHGSTEGCISNFHRETGLFGLNAEHAYVLGNKLVFSYLMTAVGAPHPRIFGYTHHSRWHWLADGEAALQGALADGTTVVVKPIRGKKGASIEFIRAAAELHAPRGDDVLVSSYVRQAEYAARIFAGSLNTVRILTVIPSDGVPLVAAAVHRFGTSNTRGVDNFSAGGVVARVDLVSGQLDALMSIGAGNQLVRTQDHPDTHARVEGVQVAHWEAAKALSLALCQHFPFLRYVGWDIAITDDGPVVIEGNAFPSLRFFQLYQPLLKDDGCRAFFEELL
jgi:hypothetical protein